MPNLLKLGFLCCYHNSVDEQALEMWHLINPKLEDSVPKERVEQFLKDLTYAAIDMNISKYQNELKIICRFAEDER